MTIEQKAIAYDEAIKRAKKWRNAPNADKIPTLSTRVIEEIFPELKESEEERIRKELIDFVKSRLAGFPQCEKFIAWLEKQGEKNLVGCSAEDEIEIPFGAKDTELQEVSYHIPKGFHAEIGDDKVVIKKGEKPTKWDEEDKK